jgi:hypothetical protein
VFAKSATRKTLNRFPDPVHGGFAVRELLDWGCTGQAIPDVNQSGNRPVGSQLRKLGLVAEAFRVGNCFGGVLRFFIFVLLLRRPPRSGHSSLP